MIVILVLKKKYYTVFRDVFYSMNHDNVRFGTLLLRLKDKKGIILSDMPDNVSEYIQFQLNCFATVATTTI